MTYLELSGTLNLISIKQSMQNSKISKLSAVYRVIPLNVSAQNQRTASMRQFLFFLAEYTHLWHTSQIAGRTFGAQRYRAATVSSSDIKQLRLTVINKHKNITIY